MSSWMRTDIDFGVPWKRFTCGVHSEFGRAVHEHMKGLDQRTEGWCERLAAFIEARLFDLNPFLTGLSVIGMQEDRHGMRWQFDVVHRSFPRVPMGAVPEPENLERCSACRRPLPLDGPFWAQATMGPEGALSTTCCSRECSSKLENRLPPVEWDKETLPVVRTACVEPRKEWNDAPLVFTRKPFAEMTVEELRAECEVERGQQVMLQLSEDVRKQLVGMKVTTVHWTAAEPSPAAVKQMIDRKLRARNGKTPRWVTDGRDDSNAVVD